MNFYDMMLLTGDNIIENRILYSRKKTNTSFNIKILEPVAEILEYYKKTTNQTSYIFPIILNESSTPQQIENRKHKMLKRYNKDLKTLADLCGIKESVIEAG
jgi:hypothetical protein